MKAITAKIITAANGYDEDVLMSDISSSDLESSLSYLDLEYPSVAAEVRDELQARTG